MIKERVKVEPELGVEVKDNDMFIKSQSLLQRVSPIPHPPEFMTFLI